MLWTLQAALGSCVSPGEGAQAGERIFVSGSWRQGWSMPGATHNRYVLVALLHQVEQRPRHMLFAKNALLTHRAGISIPQRADHVCDGRKDLCLVLPQLEGPLPPALSIGIAC